MPFPRIIGASVIISDCIDENARVRQQCRYASLFNVEPSYIGVSSSFPELEAAGHLVDVLDANRCISHTQSNCSNSSHSSDSATSFFSAVVIVNVAPRTDSIRKHYDNGTPFCYFQVENTLVVSTFSQAILGLLFRILGGETDRLPVIHLMNTSKVINFASENKWLDKGDVTRIINTQFRSYEFVPLAAFWIVTQGSLRALPHEEINFTDETTGPQDFIWFIDNFGNCKTSILTQDISFDKNKTLRVSLANNEATLALPTVKRLSDATPKVPTVTIGSSGYKNSRFLELVIKNASFAQEAGAAIGPISISK